MSTKENGKKRIRNFAKMSAIIDRIKRVFAYTLRDPSFKNCKMVLVVRTDILMGKGKTAAQCAHAAIECYRQAMTNSKYKAMCESWLLEGQPKIVLKSPNEEGLVTLARIARKSGLTISLIKDAGKTQLESGTVTTLGIGPGPKQVVDSVTSKLKLM